MATYQQSAPYPKIAPNVMPSADIENQSHIQRPDSAQKWTNLTAAVMAGGIIALLVVFVIGALLSLSITAVIISQEYNHDDCIGRYNGIEFSYTTWLDIYGWTNIGMLIYTILTAVLFFCLNDPIDKCVVILGGVLFILYVIFQFAWFVVGAVLFFAEINRSCPESAALFSFGLALFIIQTIVFCGAKVTITVKTRNGRT